MAKRKSAGRPAKAPKAKRAVPAEVSACARELGRKGAAARWAGHTKKGGSKRPSKARASAAKAKATVAAIPVDVRPVEAGLARLPLPAWGPSNKRAPLRAPAKQPWGAAKQLSSGLQAPSRVAGPDATDTEALVNAFPLIISGKPPTRYPIRPLTGKAIAEARQEASLLAEGTGADYFDPTREAPPNSLMQADAKLISGQHGKVVVTMRIGVDSLTSGRLSEEREARGGFDPLRRYWNTFLDPSEAYPVTITVEGSNAHEHKRALTSAYRAFFEALHSAKGRPFATGTAGISRTLSIEAFGPKDPQAGVSQDTRTAASSDGQKRVIAQFVATYDRSRGTVARLPSGSLRAFAQACSAAIERLWKFGYNLRVGLFDYKGAVVMAETKSVPDLILRLVKKLDADQQRNERTFEVRPGPLDESASKVRVSDIVLDDTFAGSVAKRREPIVSTAGLGDRKDSELLGIPRPMADAIYSAFRLFKVSRERAERLYSAIAEWAGSGGRASVLIDTRWYETNGGDSIQRGGSYGVRLNDYSQIDPQPISTRVEVPAEFQPGSGTIERLRIVIEAGDAQLRRLNLATVNDLSDVLERAGFDPPAFIEETNEYRLQKGFVWRGRFKREGKIARESSGVVIGYPDKVAAVRGSELSWTRPTAIAVSRARWERASPGSRIANDDL